MFVPVVFLIIIVSMLVIQYRRRQLINAAWSRIARANGLALTEATLLKQPTMHGEINGASVMVEVYAVGSGNDRKHYTRWVVDHVPAGPPVTIKRQGSFSWFRQAFGGNDVQIGDPFFDDQVKIVSHEPAELAAFLTPARRAAVLDLLASWPRATVTNSSISVERRGTCFDDAELIGTLNRLVDTAAIMGASTRVDEILAHQAEGDLLQAAGELHEINREAPNAFTELLEAEALTEAGRHQDAATILDGLGERMPEDPTISGWSDVARLPAPPPVPVPMPSADPAIPSPIDLRQDAVLDDLFSSDRMSWEVVEYFEGTYHGSVVEWRGTVVRSQSYQRDLDFGVGPGRKVTVLVGHSGTSDVISNEVHAVVELPDGPQIRNGTELQFRGTLTNVDRFSRKVWVRGAASL